MSVNEGKIHFLEEQIDFSVQSTLRLKWGDIPFFGYPWHYHNEHEIVYLLESTGTRFVADHIENFGPGDLVMLAGSLPHYWHSDEKYRKGDSDLFARRLVVQFPNDFMKTQINTYAELAALKNLFKNSEKGIRFLPPQSDKIGRMLLQLPQLKGFKQLIRFLEILQHMAHNTNYKLLASDAYNSGQNAVTDQRLQKVIGYMISNFQNHISLDEMANLAGMQRTAFCRFFKDKTGRSFITYLNELRIGFACKLLIKGDMQILRICYETGFNSLSGFNRTFKRITGLNPKQYQKRITEGSATK